MKTRVAVICVGHLWPVTAPARRFRRLELVGLVDARSARADENPRAFGTRAWPLRGPAVARCLPVTISAPTEAHVDLARRFWRGLCWCWWRAHATIVARPDRSRAAARGSAMVAGLVTPNDSTRLVGVPCRSWMRRASSRSIRLGRPQRSDMTCIFDADDPRPRICSDHHRLPVGRIEATASMSSRPTASQRAARFHRRIANLTPAESAATRSAAHSSSRMPYVSNHYVGPGGGDTAHAARRASDYRGGRWRSPAMNRCDARLARLVARCELGCRPV